MAWARCGWLLLLALVGCAGRGRSRSADDVDVASVRASVTRLRGLPQRRPTPIDILDEESFLEQLSDRGGAGPPVTEARDRLGVAAASVAAEIRATALESTLGFYDVHEEAIVLREPNHGDRDRLPLSWILAHELTHALQHQNFRIRDVDSLASTDEQLAYLALVEGDAMVTMIAHGALEHFVPVHRALLITMRNIGRGEADRLSQFGAPPPQAGVASPVVRARMEFPYVAGTTFVGLVHRTGGFELVNQMYERPPRSTEQVLHPDKYLRGEGPVEIAGPEPPPGTSARIKGTMGELGIRSMLEACVDEGAAASAAAGWGGDAFAVVERPGQAPLILWSTAWDTPNDAAEFATAVGACSDARGAGHVGLVGDRVSVITGPLPPTAPELHRYLLGLPASRPPPTPPLAVTALRGIPPLPAVPPATLSAERYDSPRLDLALPVPPGFRASLVDGALVLEGEDGLMEVDFSPATVTTESTAKVYRDFIRSLQLPRGGLAVIRNDRMRTPVGDGLERTWGAPGTSVRLQVLVLPVCGGEGAVIVKRLWATDRAGELPDWVIQSARRGHGGAPPVCAELN